MDSQEIKKLISSANQQLTWVVEFNKILKESEFELTSTEPGNLAAKEVLADVRLHKLSTARAGAFTAGFDELIAAAEQISQDEKIFITGIKGEKNWGVLYYTPHGKVLAGVVVARRLPLA